MQDEETKFFPALRTSDEASSPLTDCLSRVTGWTTDYWNTNYLPLMKVYKSIDKRDGYGVMKYDPSDTNVYDNNEYNTYSGVISDHFEFKAVSCESSGSTVNHPG